MKHSIMLLTSLALLILVGRSPAEITKATPRQFPHPVMVGAYGADGGGGGFVTPTPNRALVIPKTTLGEKVLAELEEDLNVMTHILEKVTDGPQEKTRSAMGIVIHDGLFGSRSGPMNLYLEDYGAIFFLEVNFPMSAPAVKSAEAEAKEETSSQWEEARRELYQEPVPGLSFALPGIANWGGPAPEAYDADKVEQLTKDLVRALKNAAHIRRLKADESVTVVVSGRSGPAESRVVTRRTGSKHATVAFSSRNTTEGRGTKLVLRVRRADIEAFQKDKLDFDKFRDKVAVTIY